MRKLLCAALLLVCAGITPILSQELGQISGAVTDKSGAVVVNVTVKAIEVKTGFSRSVVSGSDGLYLLTGLRPAEYEILGESTGFRTFRRPGVELLANQSLTLNIALEVGAITETVTVAGAVVQVNTTTSTSGGVVDHARIVDLVLNGRDIAKLASVVAGMNVISISSESGKSIPGGLQLSSNGTRNQQISYRLDGASNTNYTSRKIRLSRSPMRYRSFPSRPATTPRRMDPTPVRSSTSLRDRAPTSCTAARLNSFATVSSTRATPSRRLPTSSNATNSAPMAADLSYFRAMTAATGRSSSWAGREPVSVTRPTRSPLLPPPLMNGAAISLPAAHNATGYCAIRWARHFRVIRFPRRASIRPRSRSIRSSRPWVAMDSPWSHARSIGSRTRAWRR